MRQLLFPALVSFVALAIGIPSYITWSRRWTGMIAGFDPARCTDVEGLTRWVGLTGVAVAVLLGLAAVLVWMVPEARRIASVVVAVIVVVGTGTTMTGCSRFTKR
jgi:hypothetical protein